jgi:low affinity Fe/Cu permease
VLIGIGDTKIDEILVAGIATARAVVSCFSSKDERLARLYRTMAGTDNASKKAKVKNWVSIIESEFKRRQTE